MSAVSAVTPESANVQVVTSFVESFLALDVDGALAHIHPDVVAYEPAGLPYGGEFRGRDGFLNLAQKINGLVTFDVSEAKVHEAGDDNVLVIFQVRFTSRETRAFIDTQVAEFYSLTDGQVSKINIFYKDTKVFVEELGFA